MKPTTFSKQFRYTGQGYLDVKMGPVADMAALKKFISPFELKEGMSVVVIKGEDGLPGIYWYIGGSWQKANASDADVKTAIEELKKKNEEQDRSIASQIEAIAKTNASISGLETRTKTLEDQILSISGGKPKVDGKSLEYVKEPETQEDILGVKISRTEGNMLVKKDDGLASIMMVMGDDVNTEII